MAELVEQAFAANNDIFLWFVIITLYGVLIPNTPRRAALVTGTVTSVAAASMLLAWSRYNLPKPMWTLWGGGRRARQALCPITPLTRSLPSRCAVPRQGSAYSDGMPDR